MEQIVKLGKEMSQVHTLYRDAESHYGSDLLNLVLAKGYLAKLLGNEAVKTWNTLNWWSTLSAWKKLLLLNPKLHSTVMVGILIRYTAAKARQQVHAQR